MIRCVPGFTGEEREKTSQVFRAGKCPAQHSQKSSNSRFAQLNRLICVSSSPFSSFRFILFLLVFSANLARSTAAEVNFRVDTIYGLLTEGQSRGQIVQFAANQWKCSARQADEYIQRARIRLEEDAAMTRPSWIAEALGRLRTYEQSAYKRGQTQVAINAVQLQAKLIGLDL